MNHNIKNICFLILGAIAFAGMITLAGCSDDDDPVQVVSEPHIGPESPDELMIQFLMAYETMDLVDYLALLDPDFLTLLTQQTMDEFPDVGTTLDFAMEKRIHLRMFSGISITDPLGDMVPAVQAIEIRVFKRLDTWAHVGEGDRFPGTVWAPFEVSLLFDRGEDHAVLKFDGVVKIHARSHLVTIDGKDITYFLMAGMTDDTYFGKGVEGTPWGTVKVMYR